MKKLVLVLSLFLFACTRSNQEPVVVLPVMLASATAYIDPSYPTAQAQPQVASQEARGVQVNMQRVYMDGKNVNAEVCFTLPDTSDWGIQMASLTYGQTIVQEFGTMLTSLQEASDGVPGLRCDTLTFIVPPDAELAAATIVIDSIAAVPREGEYCAYYMPKIQQALADRGIAIILECLDVNGVQTMQITSFPPEMTVEQAQQVVFSDEFYSVKGPWTFAFNLSQ